MQNDCPPNACPVSGNRRKANNRSRDRGSDYYDDGRQYPTTQHRPNETKMSDGGRERASLGVEVWKSFQKWSVQRSAVRSIAWLDRISLEALNLTVIFVAKHK